MANRTETNAVIRQLLATIGATITRAPEGDDYGCFSATLPAGGDFYAHADRTASGGYRIVLSPCWGACEVITDGGRARSRRPLTEGAFLRREDWGRIGKPTFSPERPLDAIARAAERRFFATLRELWPQAVAHREQCARDADGYGGTAELCAGLRRDTKGGYALAPAHISHAGLYATFHIDIPRAKLADFFVWCEENEVAR